MQTTKQSSVPRMLIAFLAAVVVATVWGAVVQTQFNLAALGSIGTDISAGVNLRTTMRDIASGFSPTYGGYVVLPALLVAFLVAKFVAERWNGFWALWFALAGVLGIGLAIPLVNTLSPVALLVGATREFLCTVLMALGGGVAGLVFRRAAVSSPADQQPSAKSGTGALMHARREAGHSFIAALGPSLWPG